MDYGSHNSVSRYKQTRSRLHNDFEVEGFIAFDACRLSTIQALQQAIKLTSTILHPNNAL